MKRYIIKLLSVLLTVVLIVGLLPVTALAAEEYDVWVGGVRVTEDNKDDVLGDGTVVFTPATEDNDAKLTLNDANITGAAVPELPDDNIGIFSEIDLILELQGDSTITAKEANGDSVGILILPFGLTITGSGTLEVTAGKSGESSFAIEVILLAIQSGTIRATGGEGADESEGVFSLGLLMEGGTLIAAGGKSPESYGILAYTVLSGGTVTATGQTPFFTMSSMSPNTPIPTFWSTSTRGTARMPGTARTPWAASTAASNMYPLRLPATTCGSAACGSRKTIKTTCWATARWSSPPPRRANRQS